MPQKLSIEQRLAKWEGKHGLTGAVSSSGRSIHRMCTNAHCGRATASLAQSECVRCEKRSGKWQGGKRIWECDQQEAEAENVAEQEQEEEGNDDEDGLASSVEALAAEEVVEDVLAAQRPRQAPRRPPPAVPGRYLRCRTKDCGRIAKHRGTLCPRCWVAKDPDARACPTCKKAPRCSGRQWGICSSCTRNVERAVGRLWQVAGGQMAIACSALAKHAMDEDSTHEANQLLEALEVGALASSGDPDVGLFDA